MTKPFCGEVEAGNVKVGDKIFLLNVWRVVNYIKIPSQGVRVYLYTEGISIHLPINHQISIMRGFD